jgi:hypothetical protein
MPRFGSLVLLCALIGFADARPASGQEKKRAVVVPVELAGYFASRAEWRREFTAALENRLRSARFNVVAASTLSKAESECRESECLKTIVKAHGADVAVAARVLNDEQRLTTYLVLVRLVERAPGGEPTARERERQCTNCTEGQARDLLATLLSATLANEPEPIEPPPVKPPSHDGTHDGKPIVEATPKPPISNGHVVELPPPPRPVEDHLSRRTRLVLRGVGFGLVGLGILGWIQGGVEKAHDGEPINPDGSTGCGVMCEHKRDTSKGQTLFFSLGAVALVGGAALAVVSWVPLPKRHPSTVIRIAPAVSPTAAKLDLEIGF